MKTRIEFRAIRIRQLRTGEDQNLSVSKFGSTGAADPTQSASHDLLDVLEAILGAKLGAEQILRHEDDDGKEDPAAENKPKRAIAVTSVGRSERTLRVDFEWSLTAPTRIVNLDSGETTYRGKEGDAGMTGGTVAIRVPEKGQVAYIAVEHRSGLVSVFEPAIVKWFREYSPVEDFRMHLSGYVPEDFWRQFLENGTVLELNMERHVVPRDIADMATGDQDVSRISQAGMTRVHIEVTEGASAPAKSWLQKKWEEITSSSQSDGAGVFLYQGEQYSKLKAKMSHQGVERTIVVGPEPDGRIAPAFPVEVSESSPGVADSTSLFQEMLALLDDTLGG